jgi:hypothetical protein
MKEKVRRTWRLLVAGEGTEDGGLGTWRRAAAAVAAQSSPPETDSARRTRENDESREREREWRVCRATREEKATDFFQN